MSAESPAELRNLVEDPSEPLMNSDSRECPFEKAKNLKGSVSVWRRDNQSAPGPKESPETAEEFRRIVKVLQHLRAHDYIETETFDQQILDIAGPEGEVW